MDWKVWAAIGVGVLAVAIGVIAWMGCCRPPGEKPDPCMIGNLKVCSVEVPEKTTIDYKAPLTPDIVELYNKGELYIFHECVEGGRTEENYEYAKQKIIEDISQFMGTVVESVAVTLKINDSEFYNKVSRLISNNIVAGMRILSKYRYVRIPLDRYCVIAFYHPSEALKIIESNQEIIDYLKDHGIDPKEFEKLLTEKAKEIHKQ